MANDKKHRAGADNDTAQWQAECAEYIGRSRTQDDNLAVVSAQLFQATLDREPVLSQGDKLPPLWHWLYFHDRVKQSELGEDGHEKRGLFLPPVPYTRRMWAASRVNFLSPLRLGYRAVRRSTLKTIEFKRGASGPLCFVRVEHVYSQDGIEAINEIQTIVYRDGELSRQAATPQRVCERETGQDHRDWIAVDRAFLFRYSALTFNTHLIHYDRDYAKQHEGYPGLVVHGPLLATLLMDHAVSVEPQRVPSVFEFRALSPVFENETFSFSNEEKDDDTLLAVLKPDGGKAVSATLRWQS